MSCFSESSEKSQAVLTYKVESAINRNTNYQFCSSFIPSKPFCNLHWISMIMSTELGTWYYSHFIAKENKRLCGPGFICHTAESEEQGQTKAEKSLKRK
jgi:hypothetical protein